jgi:hypothetical protein
MNNISKKSLQPPEGVRQIDNLQAADAIAPGEIASPRFSKLNIQDFISTPTSNLKLQSSTVTVPNVTQ